ncbi:DNA segregation ATPase FtsK/SpoIIIE, S-DNA-T family [Chitinophaga costaii]|uniref:DNA segregation ATPase FtsK/SpoIIIE, S-DNA-T family n=1 Tax=Chitinophaga costaii TaxID=1335309 RepID=A0A1C4E7Z1_9BACT|nr:DNA translocase FtsK [Chitinophaga costaii]PUZ24262.1 DNA translocase FtsK [Chitinophaga costaii]SCC39665.1 DNA segregation ATPase FtsK/SpoIIIE, S-DNA-T family [Chitinophaga costaii]
MSKNKLKNEKPDSKKTPPAKDPAMVLKADRVADVKVKELVKDERTHKVLGVGLLLLALLGFIAFTSYLFTWEEDQDKVFRYSFHLMFMGDEHVENLLGRSGAFISHWFFYNGFGLACYLFCYFAFILGTNFIVGRRVFRVWRNVKYVLFGLLYISMATAFVAGHAGFPWGGAVGNALNRWTTGFLGTLGTGLLLLVIGFCWLIWKFNFEFKLPQRKPKPKPVATPEVLVEEMAAEPEPVMEKSKSKKNGLKNDTGVTVIPPAVIDPEETGVTMELIEREEPVVSPLITVIPAAHAPQLDVLVPEEADGPPPFAMNDEKVPDLEETFAPANNRRKNNAPMDVAFEVKPVFEDEPAVDDSQDLGPAQPVSVDPYDPILDLRDYKYPILELLDQHSTEKVVQDAAELEKNKNQIIDTLKNYDIAIQKISATVGPTVTLYEIVPAAGVRISRIKNLEDDIALSLSALGIRIIAPIPGKGTIGIEVPNIRKSIVSLKNMLSSDKFQNSSMDLPIAIGKKIDNENFIADLSKMPHLLMAGATGQGKSVGINTLLVSLLYKKHPSQLKFVLVDPKKVELSLYKLIEKHFLAKLPGEEEAIITDTKKVIHTLNALCIEMDLRYDLLKEAGTRNIREYNAKFTQRRLNPEKGHRYLPFIVLVIDEFADLIMTAGKEVEMPIARLAQLARAVGIHLIIATQRPSVNIITGTIKANFPARIAFKVSSKIDSRTILDIGGAEQLIGQGDMLVSFNGELVRLQCAFVDTPEVERVAEFIGQQRGYPDAFLLPEYVDEKDLEGKEFSLQDRDPLFEEAARIIVQTQQGSTSLLQRRMKLGYNRAGRLMDQLEAAGIVGPNMGSKAREVQVKSDGDLEEILDGLL